MAARLVTLLSTILLISHAWAVCPEPSARTAPRPLRFVSFNLLHGGLVSELWGDGEQLDERLAIATDELRALDVDVIGLQEASTGWWRGDVTGRLAAALGYAHEHAGSTSHYGLPPLGLLTSIVLELDEGPAIVSRFPIAASRAWVLDPCGTLYRRALLCAEVCTPWGGVDVCSVHLNGESCQAASTAEHLREFRTRLPLILMGDLNATEDDPSVRLLRDRLGFIDVFRTANPQRAGFTGDQEVEDATPMASERIDYVLLSPGSGRGSRIQSSRVVLNVPGQDADGNVLWPSDHYGVLAEVDVLSTRTTRVPLRGR